MNDTTWNERVHLQKLVNEAQNMLGRVKKGTDASPDDPHWDSLVTHISAALQHCRPDSLSSAAESALWKCEARKITVKKNARKHSRQLLERIRSRLATRPQGLQLWGNEVRELHDVIDRLRSIHIPDEEIAPADALIKELEVLESESIDEVHRMKQETDVIEAFWAKDEQDVCAKLELMRPSALKTVLIKEDLPRLTKFLSAESELNEATLQPTELFGDSAKRRIDRLQQAIASATAVEVPTWSASKLLLQWQAEYHANEELVLAATVCEEILTRPMAFAVDYIAQEAKSRDVLDMSSRIGDGGDLGPRNALVTLRAKMGEMAKKTLVEERIRAEKRNTLLTRQEDPSKDGRRLYAALVEAREVRALTPAQDKVAMDLVEGWNFTKSTRAALLGSSNAEDLRSVIGVAKTMNGLSAEIAMAETRLAIMEEQDQARKQVECALSQSPMRIGDVLQATRKAKLSGIETLGADKLVRSACVPPAGWKVVAQSSGCVFFSGADVYQPSDDAHSFTVKPPSSTDAPPVRHWPRLSIATTTPWSDNSYRTPLLKSSSLRSIQPIIRTPTKQNRMKKFRSIRRE